MYAHAMAVWREVRVTATTDNCLVPQHPPPPNVLWKPGTTMILIPDGQVSLGSWASGSCNGGGGSAVVELTVSVGAGAGVC
jgi:hypothetical protein